MSWNIAKPGDQINGPVAVTGNLNVDSNTLFVDSATNRVGVLTASPTVPLDVVGDAKVSGNLTVDTNTLVVDAANNRLGIGTATPATALHVFGTGSQALSVERDGATIQSRLEIISGNSTNLIRATVAKDLLVEQGTGTEVLRIATNGVCTWSNVVNAGTAMTLNGTGLGVGGSIFSNSKLTLVSAAGVDCMLALQKTGGSNTSVMMTDGTNAWLGSSSGSTGKKLIYALAAPDNSVVIDSSGNVGIGTATPISYAANARVLHIDGGANSSEIRLTNNTTGTANTDGGLLTMSGSNLYVWNNENASVIFGTNNGTKATLDASGNLGVGATTILNRAQIQGAGQATTTVSDNGDGSALFLSDTGSAANNGGLLFLGSASANGQRPHVGIKSLLTDATANGTGDMAFLTRTTTGATTLTEKMRLLTNGNLVLGRTSPLFGSVSGRTTFTIDGSAGSIISWGYNGTVSTYIVADAAGTELGEARNQPVRFITNSTERLRIKATGQLNFTGLASDPAGAAAGDVYYNTSTNKLKCYNGTTWNDLF